MIRVLHVVKSLDRGGAEVLLLETGRVSRPAVKPSYAWLLRRSDAVVAELRNVGEVTCLGAESSATTLLSVGRLAKLVRQQRPDIIHAHLPLAGVVARIVGANCGLPVVYTEHNIFGGYHPLTQLAARATWPLQQAVIAVSHSVARSLPNSVNDPPVSVIQNGVAVARFQSSRSHRLAVRASLGIAPDEVVVITVAVFREAKRLERLVEVAAAFANNVSNGHGLPRVRFVLVGDGPLGAQVRADAARVAPDVLQLLGARTDVADLLAAADLFMLTSVREGLPVAILEAMAAGLPVISTAVGGIAEVVDDACGRLTYETEDDAVVGALVESVRELAGDAHRRRDLGACASQRVADRFSVQRMAQEITSVYEQVLG